MDHLPELPIHIKYLISDLEACYSPVTVLSRYISTLPTDPILTEIFKDLGYNEETDCFVRKPSQFESLQALKAYKPEDDLDLSSDSWEVSRGIKEEFLKTFYESKLNDLSDPFDLGLSLFATDEEAGLNDLWTTPTRKVAESISTEESTPRQCRGLKYLTSKVRSITYAKGFFSYKEVSDELVRELEITDGLDREKEEKNILRRVYDALNVLIASEVVVKQGKKYVWQNSGFDQADLNKREAEKTRERIQAKKTDLRELIRKKNAVQALVRRNMQNLSKDVIQFPFLIIATEEHPENMVKIECNPEHTEICMKFKKEIKVCKDIEMVLKLQIPENDEKLEAELAGLV